MQVVTPCRSAHFSLGNKLPACSLHRRTGIPPDDGVGAVAARYGRGLLPRRAQDLQRGVDVHLRRVLNGELHHLGGDEGRFALRLVR